MSSRQASIFGRGAGPQRTLAAAAVLPLLAALAAGCGAPVPAENDAALAGPIVVITLSALPVDALGDATWTPALDELAARSWSNSALAPSSSPIPSLGSLLTGIDPWLHQAYSHRAGPMREGVPTLPQRLTEAGWSTRAFFPLHHRLHRFGFFAGFDSVEESGEDESTRSALRDAPDASLTWIHLPDPGFPYVDRREQLPRLPELQAETERIERRWLMPYADPELDMPEPLLSAAQELYRHQVAWADHRLGRLIEALRTNPRWERCTLIVTALHGNELAARGQVLFAQNLSRPSLEVPLIVRIPEGAGRDLPDSGAAVSTSRLAATVLDLAGLSASPAQRLSLFEAGAEEIPAALYDQGGVNRFSLFRPEGPRAGLQLIWSSRYADPEPEFWPAQAIEAGLLHLPIRERAGLILGRLQRSFDRTAPLSGRANAPGDSEGGGGGVELKLVRWRPDGSVEEVEDPETRDRMAESLRRGWMRFIGIERSPAEERRYRKALASQAPAP